MAVGLPRQHLVAFSFAPAPLPSRRSKSLLARVGSENVPPTTESSCYYSTEIHKQIASLLLSPIAEGGALFAFDLTGQFASTKRCLSAGASCIKANPAFPWLPDTRILHMSKTVLSVGRCESLHSMVASPRLQGTRTNTSRMPVGWSILSSPLPSGPEKFAIGIDYFSVHFRSRLLSTSHQPIQPPRWNFRCNCYQTRSQRGPRLRCFPLAILARNSFADYYSVSRHLLA